MIKLIVTIVILVSGQPYSQEEAQHRDRFESMGQCEATLKEAVPRLQKFLDDQVSHRNDITFLLKPRCVHEDERDA